MRLRRPRVIGVSVLTVRRWIKAGKLRAEMVQGQRGPEDRVHLDHRSIGDRRPVMSDHPPANTEQRSRANSDHVVDHRRHDRLIALLDTVTADDRRLIDERAELYGRLGCMSAQLAAEDETIKALQAPQEPIAPPPPAGAVFEPLPAEPDPPRRPWGRFR